jgi:GGDEF domain-containing protein
LQLYEIWYLKIRGELENSKIGYRMIATNQKAPNSFINRAGIELHRAERYRVFVSLTVLDLSHLKEAVGERFADILGGLSEVVRSSIRACDYIAQLDDSRLGLLLPETSRQGAEIAVKRISEVIRTHLSKTSDRKISEVIPVEIASYPDTGGAKTLSGFLEELASRSRN